MGLPSNRDGTPGSAPKRGELMVRTLCASGLRAPSWPPPFSRARPTFKGLGDPRPRTGTGTSKRNLYWGHSGDSVPGVLACPAWDGSRCVHRSACADPFPHLAWSAARPRGPSCWAARCSTPGHRAACCLGGSGCRSPAGGRWRGLCPCCPQLASHPQSWWPPGQARLTRSNHHHQKYPKRIAPGLNASGFSPCHCPLRDTVTTECPASPPQGHKPSRKDSGSKGGRRPLCPGLPVPRSLGSWGHQSTVAGGM